MSKRKRNKTPKLALATIDSLSHEGRGVAQVEGKTYFIDGALPGETVECLVLRNKSSYAEATVTQIMQASPHRVTPQCQHFGVCGGCRQQHMPETLQIEHKQQVLLELLAHQANAAPQIVLKPLTGPTWQYRTKARLSVKHVPKKEKVLVGFREKQGRYVADIHACPILDARIGTKITALSELILQMQARDLIPQLEIATSEDCAAIIIRHLEPLSEQDKKLWKQFADEHNLQLYLQSKGPDTIQLFYPEDADPLLSYQLNEFDLKLKFHPAEFTQINTAINQKMLQQAIELLEPQKTDNVLDLFCGIGNFTLPLARHCKHVTGVEGHDVAVMRAAQNAQQNSINNTNFFVANLMEPIEEAWVTQPYHKVLLDPPRAGAKEVLSYAHHWQAEKIVYVSCNPITLARDTQLLIEQGYTLAAAGVMDMFPHTQHVEAMALFTKT